MTDKKRPGTMSDDERARIGAKHRANPRGVPIVGGVRRPSDPVVTSYDDSHTPPPQPLPTPDEIDGADELSAPTRAQIDTLHEKVNELTNGLAETWEARHISSQLARIDLNLARLAEDNTRNVTMVDEVIVPQLNDLKGVTKTVGEQLPLVLSGLQLAETAVRGLTTRFETLEKDRAVAIANYNAAMTRLDERLADGSEAFDDLRTRMKALEEEKAQRDGETKAIEKVGGKRGAATGGVVGAVVSAIISAIIGAAK